MKITGYALRTAIKAWEVRRDSVVTQFAGSLKKFEDEDKLSPQALTARYTQCEFILAQLQTAQARYNLEVMVQIPAQGDGLMKVPLAFAIKVIGGMGRVGKMWRDVATGAEGKNRYSYGQDDSVRDPNQIRAKETVSRKDATVIAEKLDRAASKVRQAIAEANSVEVDLGDTIEPGWLE
jgi:hypothetical protein